MMMCTTVLHGGVCHRTSTPHKSGIKMKEKKIYFPFLMAFTAVSPYVLSIGRLSWSIDIGPVCIA